MLRRILFLLAALSVWICTPRQEPMRESRIVSRVEVTASIDGEIIPFSYSDQEKMETILNYLRLLEPDIRHPLTPDTFRVDAYEIRLTMLDGSQTVYYQLYDNYLRKNDGAWYAISPTDGSMLHPLLLSMPSDDQ